jgi:hypothetical protein
MDIRVCQRSLSWHAGGLLDRVMAHNLGSFSLQDDTQLLISHIYPVQPRPWINALLSAIDQRIYDENVMACIQVGFCERGPDEARAADQCYFHRLIALPFYVCHFRSSTSPLFASVYRQVCGNEVGSIFWQSELKITALYFQRCAFCLFFADL